jgi:hypothetical protein
VEKYLDLVVSSFPANLGALLLYTMVLLSACSSAPTALSVELYNAKTNQTLTCAARDELGWADRDMLALTVENCARQLEAHGFVRKN